MKQVKPLGVTVITKSYRKVGRKAVSLFKKNTGLEVLVIEGDDSEGFELKLKLDKLCGRRPIIFLDADWWILRKADLSGLIPTSGFYGVLDSAVYNPKAFPYGDCKENGLDASKYLNTGFFACDLRDPITRNVFKEARKSWSRYKAGKAKFIDVTDQAHLNYALLKVPVSLLPLTFNFYYKAAAWGQLPYIPRDILGLHAAGISTKEKYEQLMLQYKVFSHPICAMHDDAILAAYSRNYQL